VLLATALFGGLIAAVAFSAATVSARATERNGRPAAEVVVGKATVVELFTSAGHYSPMQRAEIAAGRLQSALKEKPKPTDVKVSPIGKEQGLYVRDRLIVTVGKAEAAAHKSTPGALAKSWQKHLAQALSESDQAGAASAQADQAPQPEEPKVADKPVEPTAAPKAADEIDWSGTAQKWVPILSIEQGGAYIGAAQIAGPTEQVEKVKGVAELRLSLKNIARIYAYIPVSSINLTKLDRVQGVSVWATGDIRLVRF
jgi:hypothetical protein